MQFSPSVDLCYRGQAFTLNLNWQDRETTEARFHELHEQRFGHRLDIAVELVNVQLGVTAPELDRDMTAALPLPANGSSRTCPVYGIDRPVPVWHRNNLKTGQRLFGPAIILDEVATSWVEPRWNCRLDDFGNLDLVIGPDSA